MVLFGAHSRRQRDRIRQARRHRFFTSDPRSGKQSEEKLFSVFHGYKWLCRESDYCDFIAVAV